MPNLVVTSSNRGIGREFVRQCAAEGWRVIAACREPAIVAEELRALGPDVRPIAMDVTDLASVEAVAAEDDDPVDLLVNSAGVCGSAADGVDEVNYLEWAHLLDVNLMGPVRVLDAFADRLAAAGGKAITITSGMGSIGEISSPRSMMYRTSKAGVNMAMRARALELGPRGVLVAVINPGWVQTDMGGEAAPTTVEESVAGMRRQIDALSPDGAGSFLDWRGRAYAW